MKRSWIPLTLLLALPLSGCVALDAGVIASYALDSTVNVVTNDGDIRARPEQRIYPVTLHDQTLFTKGCTYRGVIALFARDWDVLAEDGRVIFKADPGVIHGKALIAYEKSCDNQTEPVLLVGDRPLPMIDRALAVKGDMAWRLRGYQGLQQRNDIPKWMGQVIKEIQAEAATNPAAQDFLNHVKVENGLPVAPEAPAAGASPK